jgi:hypothetical protein
MEPFYIKHGTARASDLSRSAARPRRPCKEEKWRLEWRGQRCLVLRAHQGVFADCAPPELHAGGIAGFKRALASWLQGKSLERLTVLTIEESRTWEKSLWEELERDHHQLHHVLEDVRALVTKGSYRLAAHRFGEFRLGEERHVRAEEDLLGVLARSPNCPAFVAQVRSEHTQVLEQLEEISRLLSRWESADLEDRLAELSAFLERHEGGERVFMFPAIVERERDRVRQL